MQQGDRNGPSVWQRAMNTGFADFLFVFLTIYVDDKTLGSDAPEDYDDATDEFLYYFRELARLEGNQEIYNGAKNFVARARQDHAQQVQRRPARRRRATTSTTCRRSSSSSARRCTCCCSRCTRG